jgi:hypothetical protein
VSLADWHFIPWTLQYFVGGGLALIISFYLLSKNPKSWVYRCFFLFGFSVSMWEFLAFFHRNAPTADLSAKFLEFDSLFNLLSISFLLTVLLTFQRKKLTYYLVLIPSFALGISLILTGPFDIFWSDSGWGYKFPFTEYITSVLFLAVWIGYLVFIIIISGLLIKRSKTAAARKKFVLILTGFIIFYMIGLTVSNLLMSYAGFPPLGGILTFLTFLCIAYAMSLPTGKIEALHTKNMKKFSKDYLRFLNKLLEVGPGKELGENLVKFKYHLPTLGLSNVVEFEREKISFRPEVPKLDLGEVTDKNLDFMKQRGWTLPAVKSFTDVFVDTYEAMKSQSKKDADEWFERMLRKHGAFLYKHGILDVMPEGDRIPEIFRELEVGKSYLVQEDRPRRCLEVLKEAVNYDFKGLCFTMRYPPQKIRNEYGLEEVDIIWMRLNPKKGVKTLAPDKLDELEKTISEFIASGGSVVLVDAFDQIKVVNGFEKSMKFLQKIKVAAAESRTNILISMRPESVWEEESAAIAKITKLHRSGPTWTSFELL